LGRRHTVEDVERVVRCAREAGIRSVSIDHIFAVPGQTPETWRRSLETAVALGVDHISTYGLTIEAGTPYEGWQAREPSAFFDDAHEAELYEIAIDLLESAGFEHYEISNFARPGHASAHNANYWANGEYVGLGVGAASYCDGVRSVHTRDLEEYIAAATEQRSIPGESEQLEGARRAGEAVMLALRTAQGVGLASFKERYGLDFLNFYAPVVERYRSLGLLETDATHVRLTRRGRFLANDVCAAFVTFA
jgi:oxygen-independent coproporphyrinogen-3 oxidase